MSGHDEIQDMIEAIRRVSQLGRTAAPDVAVAVEADIRRTITQGTTPDGVPWKPTQKGERPLQHATRALGVAAIGGTVYVRLTGPEAMHHKGSARGGIRRQVIPDSRQIPSRMAAEIKAVLVQHFDAAVTRG